MRPEGLVPGTVPWAVVAVALTVGGAVEASGRAREASRPTLVEPRADATLRAMSEMLAGLERFAFEAEETFDEIPDGESRRQLTNVRRVAAVAPGRSGCRADPSSYTCATWTS